MTNEIFTPVLTIKLGGVLLGVLGTAGSSWGGLQCGDKITPNKSAYLKHDLNCTVSPGLTLDSNSVLVLGHHTVECEGTDIGIRVHGSGAGLYNGTVTKCRLGVQATGSGHRIEQVNAIQNTRGNGVGFSLRGGGNSVLRYDRVQQNDIGIQIIGSQENKVEWTSMKKNNNAGIQILLGDISSNRNEIRKNKIYENKIGVQIVLGTENIVYGNLIAKNRDGGISIGTDDFLPGVPCEFVKTTLTKIQLNKVTKNAGPGGG